MCLIALAWQVIPAFRLFVVANRDEWHDRPAEPAHWWKDDSHIFAGRDLQAGGTWLGVTRSGRFAALTNFRDPNPDPVPNPSARKSVAPSRGKLVTDFLHGSQTPAQYLDSLRPHAAQYNGFNLLAADPETLLCFSSRSNVIEEIKPGIHALSNHSLNEPWPKVNDARSALDIEISALNSPIRGGLDGKEAEDALFSMGFNIFSNEKIAPDSQLPHTGVGIEWERRLSPALIISEPYGTRCTTIVGVSANEIRFEEHTRARSGNVLLVTRERFLIG
jgi:uncharacterized protein with NRDE domain